MSQNPDIQTAIVMYQSARAEILERIRLRDQMILLFLGALGTVFGIAFTYQNHELLLVVPFFSFGVATLLSQHNAVIGAIGYFCAFELDGFLQSKRHVPQWDGSETLHLSREKAIFLRSWGHVIIVLAPGLAALGLNLNKDVLVSQPLLSAWVLGALCMLAAIIAILEADRIRRYYHKQLQHKRSRRDKQGKSVKGAQEREV